MVEGSSPSFGAFILRVFVVFWFVNDTVLDHFYGENFGVSPESVVVIALRVKRF